MRRGAAELVVGGAKSASGDSNETVRVRMDRLDRMVNLTGELVITRSRFQIVARQPAAPAAYARIGGERRGPVSRH
jgi:chemotaxis protein histidine kinase CheA